MSEAFISVVFFSIYLPFRATTSSGDHVVSRRELPVSPRLSPGRRAGDGTSSPLSDPKTWEDLGWPARILIYGLRDTIRRSPAALLIRIHCIVISNKAIKKELRINYVAPSLLGINDLLSVNFIFPLKVMGYYILQFSIIEIQCIPPAIMIPIIYMPST